MVNETRQVTSNLPSYRTQILMKIGYWLCGSFWLFLALLHLVDKINEQPSNEFSITFWSVMSLSLGWFFLPFIRRYAQSPPISWGLIVIFAVSLLGAVFLGFNLKNEVVRSFVFSFSPYVLFWLAGQNLGQAVNLKST